MIRLPKNLASRRTSFEAALAKPLLGEWPKDGEKDVPYEKAEQAESIAAVLIHELHTHLVGADIAFLFKKDMKTKGRVILGKAKRAGAELHHFTEHDFVLVFNWEQWRALNGSQRVALVDHELCHCQVDDETGNYMMREHDVEEFSEIVRRWGLWKRDLRDFSAAIENAEQINIFDEQSPAGRGAALAAAAH